MLLSRFLSLHPRSQAKKAHILPSRRAAHHFLPLRHNGEENGCIDAHLGIVSTIFPGGCRAAPAVLVVHVLAAAVVHLLLAHGKLSVVRKEGRKKEGEIKDKI